MRMKLLATILLSCVMAIPAYGSKLNSKAFRALLNLTPEQIVAIRQLDNVSTFSGGRSFLLIRARDNGIRR